MLKSLFPGRKSNLTLAQWAICYAGSLGFGGLTWWATGNQWAGFGVIVIFTAAYVLLVKSRRAAQVAAAPVSTAGMSRQQRRAHERKQKS